MELGGFVRSANNRDIGFSGSKGLDLASERRLGDLREIVNDVEDFHG